MKTFGQAEANALLIEVVSALDSLETVADSVLARLELELKEKGMTPCQGTLPALAQRLAHARAALAKARA